MDITYSVTALKMTITSLLMMAFFIIVRMDCLKSDPEGLKKIIQTCAVLTLLCFGVLFTSGIWLVWSIG